MPSDQLIPRLDAWKEKAPAPAGPGCDGARGGANAAGPVVDVKVASADAQDIARSLATHGGAINTGEYQVAWQFFTAREQRSLASYNKWVDGVRSSLWTNLSVESADVRGDTATTVVRLRTTQTQRTAVGPGVLQLEPDLHDEAFRSRVADRQCQVNLRARSMRIAEHLIRRSKDTCAKPRSTDEGGGVSVP